MKTLFAAAIVFLSTQAHAAIYSCETEFGETIAIRKTVLKAGEKCESCKQMGSPIAEALIDRSLSKDLNLALETDKSLTTKIRRKFYEAEGRQIFVDTRRAEQKGRSFQFELNCPAKSGCTGKFLKTEKDDLVVSEAGPLYDKRPGVGKGRLELSLAKHGHLGFTARVFKTAVPVEQGGTMPISASGEMKFFREDPLFILNAGADEQIPTLGKNFERIAALEIGITCKK